MTLEKVQETGKLKIYLQSQIQSVERLELLPAYSLVNPSNKQQRYYSTSSFRKLQSRADKYSCCWRTIVVYVVKQSVDSSCSVSLLSVKFRLRR